MTPQQVAERVKRKDWDVLEPPGAIGADTGPALLPLLGDKDSQVRELAVTSLHAAGGPSAREGLLHALNDPTDTVRAAAARFLQKHAVAQDIPALHRVLAGTHDEYVREQVALLLGKIGASPDVPLLMQQKLKEKDEHARTAENNALVRLGDLQSTQEYVQRLHQDNPQRLVRAMEDMLYIRDPRLLHEFAPLLSDERPAKDVGPSHGPYFIRVCDVALNTIDAVLDHPFRFGVDRMKHYSTDELNQAKAVIAR